MTHLTAGIHTIAESVHYSERRQGRIPDPSAQPDPTEPTARDARRRPGKQSAMISAIIM
jgi:hypothetical protein